MTDETSKPHTRGVYFTDDSGEHHLVHAHTGEDYGLDDVCLLFGFGRLENEDGGVALVLSESEVRQLKAMADAQSFDHPEDFIAMCLDIHHFAAGRGPGPFRFRTDF